MRPLSRLRKGVSVIAVTGANVPVRFAGTREKPLVREHANWKERCSLCNSGAMLLLRAAEPESYDVSRWSTLHS